MEEKNAKLEREVKQLKKDLKEKETNQINDKKEHDDEVTFLYPGHGHFISTVGFCPKSIIVL